MVKNDIPIEGVLKYIKAERDKYKSKLEALTVYTKQLEADVCAKKDARIAELENEVEDLRKRNERLERNNHRLGEENTNLIRDYHESEWFKQMQKQSNERNRHLYELRKAFSRLEAELFQLKGSMEQINSKKD